jgi:hypothetical protein
MIICQAAKIITVLVAWFALLPAPASAQEAIIIDEGMRANANVLNVKMGVRMPGKIWKFKFGEYAVVSGKMGLTTTTTEGWFFSPVERSRTTQKFSFVIKGAGPETANVNAAQNVESEALQDVELKPGVSIRVEAIAGANDNLVASITIDGNTGESWILLLGVMRSVAGIREDTQVCILTDRTREIVLKPATSDKGDMKSRGLPARGYEFFETGRSLGALQYYGGGLFGANKNVIYMRRDLDPKTKLLLAASMTAILQAKHTAQME